MTSDCHAIAVNILRFVTSVADVTRELRERGILRSESYFKGHTVVSAYKNEVFTLVGAVSYGLGSHNEPCLVVSVFVRIQHYLGWITQNKN